MLKFLSVETRLFPINGDPLSMQDLYLWNV